MPETLGIPPLEAFQAASDWWREAGVDVAFVDDPVALLSSEAAEPLKKSEETAKVPSGEPVTAPPVENLGGDRAAWPTTLEGFQEWWQTEPTLGPGKRVAPIGREKPELMILVGQPSMEDHGTLVSQSEKALLDRMSGAMGIAGDNLYLSSALPAPQPAPDWPDLANAGYRDITLHHLAIVQPQRLLVLGRSLSPLLTANETELAATGMLELENRSIPLLTTMNLSSLLQSPSRLARLWSDWLEWTKEKALKHFSLAALVTAVTAIALPNSPALAQQPTADYFQSDAARAALPSILSAEERSHYRAVFAAIDANDWATVQALLAARQGPLHTVAQAEYYLDANSPRVELPAIEDWMARGLYLPQAQQLASLAVRRGASSTPYVPAARQFEAQGYAPKRVRPRTISDGSMPSSTRRAILSRISNDDPDGARLLLDGVDAVLSPEARAEWRQRVAWSYYIENQDAAALAMAETVGVGAGAWVAEGHWVAGLAAWRLGNCARAAPHFETAGNRAYNSELAAAGFYWASRAHIRCRRPEKAQEMLRGAAGQDETLYGMLAIEQLGRDFVPGVDSASFSEGDWQLLRGVENVRVAIALTEIDREPLADEILKHQAAIGEPRHYRAVARLARALGLPETQLWMAHRAPRGQTAEPASRYPVAHWQPVNGWQVDPALAYAHALQESNFRTRVVSPAGAIGLMQIMPITRREYAGSLGMSSGANLKDPRVNLAFGQRTLQALSNMPATQGKLPKIMAGYNAGPSPVGRWEYEVRDQNDPLLYMESIPYWETRGYVAIVMRNYWMYQRQAGVQSEGREALAENKWPMFPSYRSGNNASLRPVN